MNIPWKNRIGVKLFGMITIVITLTMLPLAYVVLVSVNNFGVYSAAVNKEQIKRQAFTYLSNLSREQGRKYDEYFNKVSVTATLLATQASQIYEKIDLYSTPTGSQTNLYWNEQNGMYLSPEDADVVTLYWGEETLSEGTSTEIQALSLLDPLLIEAKELLPCSQATHMITTSGIGKYYTSDPKGLTVARNLPRAAEFDLRDGAPMTIFTTQKLSEKKAQWTGIYQNEVGQGLMMTASGAITDSSGTFMGVVGVEMALQAIVEDVLMDKLLAPQTGGKVLFSFLVDGSGKIIAFPEEYLADFGLDYSRSELKHSCDVLRCSLKDSTERSLLEVVPKILLEQSIVEEFVLGGKRYILATETLPQLGWKLALVTLEADLILSVQRTQTALKGTLAKLKKEFLFNSIIAAVVALVLVYLAVRYFVGPLQKLSSLAQQVGEGNLAVKYEQKRRDELGALGESMNGMIKRLAQVDEIKKHYSRQLEGDIHDRTRNLELQNVELEEVVNDLHRESLARKEITLALVESERQLRSIMESSLAGLCIIQKEKFKYVNPAIVNMFGYSHSEFLEGLGPLDLMLTKYRTRAREQFKKREEGTFIKPGSQFKIQCVKRDGTIFDALVEETTTTWEGARASVGTIVDISQLKEVEEKLRVNEKRLHASLEEKDILLKEVYHRTKNNMLVIISMLALQMDGVSDEKARKIFVETENRIRAMALVHENLYRSQNLAEINLGDYLEDVVTTLVRSMTFDERITVAASCNDCAISFEKAIPLGLVVNEIVTNAVKHAFPGEGKGEVRLFLDQVNSEIELIIADNGIGLPEMIDVHNSTSFGMQITANMIERQLGGKFHVNRVEGTEYVIRLTG